MADPVEQAVWEAIQGALQQPEVLIEEYQRRLVTCGNPGAPGAECKQIALALKRIKSHEDRVTAAYINEAMGLDRYKVEMEKLKERRRDLERAARDIQRRERQEADSRKVLQHLARICHLVSEGLDVLTF